jgi:hypothetical protein
LSANRTTWRGGGGGGAHLHTGVADLREAERGDVAEGQVQETVVHAVGVPLRQREGKSGARPAIVDAAGLIPGTAASEKQVPDQVARVDQAGLRGNDATAAITGSARVLHRELLGQALAGGEAAVVEIVA